MVSNGGTNRDTPQRKGGGILFIPGALTVEEVGITSYARHLSVLLILSFFLIYNSPFLRPYAVDYIKGLFTVFDRQMLDG